MRKHTSEQHLGRAVMGLSVGMAFALISAVMGYIDYRPDKLTHWVWVVICALPIVAWGSSHLARFKGYPSSAAYALIVLGGLISGLVVLSGSPLVVGFMFIIMELLPVTVLLALPRKPVRFHRSEWNRGSKPL